MRTLASQIAFRTTHPQILSRCDQVLSCLFGLGLARMCSLANSCVMNASPICRPILCAAKNPESNRVLELPVSILKRSLQLSQTPGYQFPELSKWCARECRLPQTSLRSQWAGKFESEDHDRVLPVLDCNRRRQLYYIRHFTHCKQFAMRPSLSLAHDSACCKRFLFRRPRPSPHHPGCGGLGAEPGALGGRADLLGTLPGDRVILNMVSCSC